MSGLILKLAPKERILLNGAVLENGDRRAKLRIITPHRLPPATGIVAAPQDCTGAAWWPTAVAKADLGVGNAGGGIGEVVQKGRRGGCKDEPAIDEPTLDEPAAGATAAAAVLLLLLKLRRGHCLARGWYVGGRAQF